MLEELEDTSLRVDNVKDQAIILMTSRGPACRDVVEPKLDELNCNFDKVSQHIRTAQVLKKKRKKKAEALQFPLLSAKHVWQRVKQNCINHAFIV